MPNILDKFKKFDKTIFYKDHSELEDKIKYLKKLSELYPRNDKVKLNLKLCEIGLQGEQEIKYELKHCDIGMYVLHDVNIEYDGDKSQIDYIIITPGFTYFVECKNLIGNITVDNNGQFIREYKYNNKFIKESIYSPLTQAQKHIDIFKEIWKLRHNDLLSTIFNINFNDRYKPLVVMTSPKNILDLKRAPLEVKKFVVRSDDLVNYIEKDISNYNKDMLYSGKMIYKNAYNIMAYYNRNLNIDYDKQFEFLIKDDKKEEEIKQKLLEYRNKKHLEREIPLEYIFDDNELQLILQKMPKTIKDLEESKILKPIKLKYHGEEIIKILNNN